MNEMAVNVQQDSTVQLLINNVVLKDLVVEGLGSAFGDWHLGCCGVCVCPACRVRTVLCVTKGTCGNLLFLFDGYTRIRRFEMPPIGANRRNKQKSRAR